MANLPKVENAYNFRGGSLEMQTILDVFVLQNLIDVADAKKIKAKFKTNRAIENFLIKNRIVTQDTVNKAYSIIFKLPYVELKNFLLSDEMKTLISEDTAKKFGIVPFGREGMVLRIALSRPADLLAGYEESLVKLLSKKKIEVELFITGLTDFDECMKQYQKVKQPDLLISKTSTPVIYLRNQQIGKEFLEKIPLDFIRKYHIVVFGQNNSGAYMLAAEDPNSSVVVKILDFIERENKIKFERFATSKEDIEYALNLLKPKPIQDSNAKIQSVIPLNRAPDAGMFEDSNSNARSTYGQGDAGVSQKKGEGKDMLSSLIDNLLGQTEPKITIDPNPKSTEIDKEKVKQSAPANTQSNQAVVQARPAQPALPVIQNTKDESTAIKPKQPNPAESQNIADADSEQLDSKDLGSLLSGQNILTKDQLEKVIRVGYIPKIVAAIINFALNQRASDIHVEPEAKFLRVRCRIDGILADVAKLDLKFHPPFISRVKIMSKLKIDESRIPQDGRFDIVFADREVDVRVSTLPTVHGEKIVMRVLDKSKGILSLEDLGMIGTAFEKTSEAIKKPYGIILATGPTGSGKSTTLYAILNRISLPGVNIVTLEDPVEYEIVGINQCQIKPEIGFTFASGLRSILRQDPNIIMVGEIRDAETAGMATHAALTGHLVLSTLHTNDTSGALPRLINMGVEPFLITSSINLIVAQRLVRRICPKCREEMKIPQKLMDQLMAEVGKIPADAKDRERLPAVPKVYYGKGCPECANGFKGRIGIYEVLSMTPEIEELAVSKRPANEIKEVAARDGMITMKQDGILKAFAGMTTIDEVFQAVINN